MAWRDPAIDEMESCGHDIKANINGIIFRLLGFIAFVLLVMWL